MLFKVAILQKRATNAQVDKNIETIIETMKEAAENNADILLLPECYITGYDLPMTICWIKPLRNHLLDRVG